MLLADQSSLCQLPGRESLFFSGAVEAGAGLLRYGPGHVSVSSVLQSFPRGASELCGSDARVPGFATALSRDDVACGRCLSVAARLLATARATSAHSAWNRARAGSTWRCRVSPRCVRPTRACLAMTRIGRDIWVFAAARIGDYDSAHRHGVFLLVCWRSGATGPDRRCSVLGRSPGAAGLGRALG